MINYIVHGIQIILLGVAFYSFVIDKRPIDGAAVVLIILGITGFEMSFSEDQSWSSVFHGELSNDEILRCLVGAMMYSSWVALLFLYAIVQTSKTMNPKD